MAPKLRGNDAILAKRFEINQLFTPSTPVTERELFAGRTGQMNRLIDTVAERGRHAILYGERGVGKTSLVQILPMIIPGRKGSVKHIRVQAFPTDTFHSIAKNVFKQIKFSADLGDGVKQYDTAQTYTDEITPSDFVREMEFFTQADNPVIVIDEFNEIRDEATSVSFANTIKALSDSGTNATLVIVGVADNVSQLIKQHESIQRCTEEVPMPRMNQEEALDVLEIRLKQLDMTIHGDAKWKIVNLAKGLPAYVHSLGKHACLNVVSDGGRLHVEGRDSDTAVDSLLTSSDRSFKDAYEAATRSNQPGNLLKHVLTACSLAKTDEAGFFSPVSIREPLSGILGRSVEIANFQNHLLAFIDPKRGEILKRKGEPRAYKFRFDQPALQPYVLMRGIQEGILDDQAKRALSFPEQGELFPAT
ncbi:AAA family ATPase [Bradyrhizobium lupini]|uniref:nSTAND1 domain-containing NTPase n=1 Tax=Rhizobium lupini TaxID=136996 RepID=UPI0036731F80